MVHIFVALAQQRETCSSESGSGSNSDLLIRERVNAQRQFAHQGAGQRPMAIRSSGSGSASNGDLLIRERVRRDSSQERVEQARVCHLCGRQLFCLCGKQSFQLCGGQLIRLCGKQSFDFCGKQLPGRNIGNIGQTAAARPKVDKRGPLQLVIPVS